jgi:glycerate-2-kinase
VTVQRLVETGGRVDRRAVRSDLETGAFFDGLARSSRNAAEALAGNDSEGFFAELSDLFVTGPTGTNVDELRILLKRHD